jgi:hypothetical protein
MDWIHLAQDRDQQRALVNMKIKFRVPYIFGKFFSDTVNGGFSGKTQIHGVSYIILCSESVVQSL